MRSSLLRQSRAAGHGTFLNQSLGTSACSANSRPRLSARCVLPRHVAFASTTSPKKSKGRESDTSAVIESEELALDPQHISKSIVPDLSSTRPIPLEVPEPPHDLAWPSSKSLNPTRWDFKYLFALGKGYLTLYKTGFKNVYYNYKTMRQIRQKIGSSAHKDLVTGAMLVSAPRVSYNELELALRTQRDIKKLIPFGLILAVCGEFTPLVVLAFGSSVVPGTCVIPKQQAQDLDKMLQRHDLWAEEMRTLLRHYPTPTFKHLLRDRKPAEESKLDSPAPSPSLSSAQPQGPSQPRAAEVVTSLEAYRLGMLPLWVARKPFGVLAWPWLISAARAGSTRDMETLAAAVAVQREGGWSKKSPQDMWEWGTKYGLYELAKYARETRKTGKVLVSDEMKAALLPVFEQETRYLVNSSATETRDHETQHILDSESRDARIQRKELEKMAA